MLVFLPLSPLVLYVFACGIGLLWLGTVPLTNGLVGQIFGMRYAAMLASIVFFGHQIGSFVGVWLAGYLYDTTGSYRARSSPRSASSVFAALINLPVNEKPLAERRSMHRLWLKVVLVAALAFVTAAAFSAYLKPGMLIEFANLVLCA